MTSSILGILLQGILKFHRLRKRHSVVAELMLMPLLLLSLSGRKESSQQKKFHDSSLHLSTPHSKLLMHSEF